MKRISFLFLCLVILSCSSYESKDFVGVWQLQKSTTKNPLSIADDFLLDDMFGEKYQSIDVENDSILIFKGFYESVICHYSIDKDVLQISSDQKIIHNSEFIEFSIIDITQEKLILGQLNEKVIEFSKVEFLKIN